MAMVSVNKLADDMGMSVNDVRRIARNSGFSRYKDAKVELYNSNDFDSFGSEKMKKRKLSKEHKAKLAGKKSKR
mgnify:CR=1 FL=1